MVHQSEYLSKIPNNLKNILEIILINFNSKENFVFHLPTGVYSVMGFGGQNQGGVWYFFQFARVFRENNPNF